MFFIRNLMATSGQLQSLIGLVESREPAMNFQVWVTSYCVDW